ncbi:hypothetical protein [Caecibacteroides pullorum]|uniref:Uncharacterized protein n=1 Tax=Caecibacteroides pullorum TaxID=2725562 RepID=A0AA41D733_9BACT|nr:hypothetical protein [Caecibacteroides pullorum]MBM6856549.1 hypothetical protein [Caecibacteroides pullorum]MBV8057555.1 hypothetical protein [Caecibacteroides pullorum]
MKYKNAIQSLQCRPYPSVWGKLTMFATADRNNFEDDGTIPYPRVICLPKGLDGHEYLLSFQRNHIKKDLFHLTDFQDIDIEDEIWNSHIEISETTGYWSRNWRTERNNYIHVNHINTMMDRCRKYRNNNLPFTSKNVLNIVNELIGTEFTQAVIIPPNFK